MENTAPAGPKAISLTQERQHSWWDAGTVSFASVPSVIHEKSNLQDVARGASGVATPPVQPTGPRVSHGWLQWPPLNSVGAASRNEEMGSCVTC